MNINSNIFNNEIKEKIKNENINSLANGILMKISTFIVWFYYKNKLAIQQKLNSNNSEQFYLIYKKLYDNVTVDVDITHPNKENIVASALFSFMVLCVMNKFSGQQTIDKLFILLKNNNFLKGEENILKNKIEECLKNFKSKNFDRFKYFEKVTKQQGYYFHAFELSLYYLTDERIKKQEKEIYLTIIGEICNYGGDTDSNSAIVGTLIGPLIGYLNFRKIKENVFEEFLNFCDENRLIYSSSLMYFFVEYLEQNFSNINKNKFVDKNIKYNTLFNILRMMTEKIA
jgi:ADP-ribosylglycohydrolase